MHATTYQKNSIVVSLIVHSAHDVFIKNAH